MRRILLIVPLVAVAFFAAPASAHQPRIAWDVGTVAVSEPELSQAFYAELKGEPAVYVIDSAEPFDLYVGVTAPDIPGAETDYRVTVSYGGENIADLDGMAYGIWEPFHEEFAGDDYLSGPEFRRADAAEGEYTLTVMSGDNMGKYVLAVGEREAFGPTDIYEALTIIPRLKSDYFGKPRAQFALSIFGAAELIATIVIGFLLGLIARGLASLISRSGESGVSGKAGKRGGRNLGMLDRLVRVDGGIILLALGIWLWIPALMVLAGFMFCEAVLGWCAVYAAIGRNTRKTY